jgi:putative DNA primase/helicase
MIDPVIQSQLSPVQLTELAKMRIYKPEVDVRELALLMAKGIFGTSVIVVNLLKAVELIGPLAIDKSKRIWHYDKGVWLPDGLDELARRIVLCTGDRYRKDYINQVSSIITARTPTINGLGPLEYLNVKNGMLNWKTLVLEPHDSKHYSTYQLKIAWNPDAVCPITNKWIYETFGEELHELIWELLGVSWHPGMGFQKAIVFIGSGYNGKGTLLRLCTAALPESAICAIDPKILATNRFAAAELFGKTLNVVGDIERFTFNSTAEFKKITGEDPLYAERKNGHPFTFISCTTQLFSGNKMPPSRDTSHGWFRRWLIVPMTKQIEGKPDPNLEKALHSELEGILVKAVAGLRAAKERGGFSEPEVCKKALEDYEFSCNTAALFIGERLQFAESFKNAISKTQLLDAYNSFCRERKMEKESRNHFYEMLEHLGAGVLESQWVTNSAGVRERGYRGVAFKSGSSAFY